MPSRLGPESLAALPALVERPTYDRAALRTGIVHLGIGAFARAHLAVATEAAMSASGDLGWGIAGVSLRSAETRAALAPQGGLYTLAVRDADADGHARERLQVVGALRSLLVAPDDPDAVLAAIAAPGTRIVSLTVTEKGYHREPASGALRADDAEIAHDLAHADRPRSALGFVVRGLERRRRAGLGPLTLLSLDNLPANGDTLRGLVLDFAARVDHGLAKWIEAGCTFPNSMVDRIVPRTTDADRAAISAALGVVDAWPVVAEPFFDWVVEDRFAAGRPDWSLGGARFVESAEPYEKLKLRMVNGSHSALAYLGVVAGFETVDRAIGEPALRRFVEALLRDEVQPTLAPLAGLDLDACRERLLARFANPALQHRTRQIAMDGSQKLPQRLLDTLRDRLAAGASFDLLALAVAAWLHFLRGRDEAGRVCSIEDPLAEVLRERLDAADAAAASVVAVAGEGVRADAARAAAMCGLRPVFGNLGADPLFIEAVARQWALLRRHGIVAGLDAVVTR